MDKIKEIVDLINQVPVHLGTLIAFAVIACIYFGFERLEEILTEKRDRKTDHQKND